MKSFIAKSETVQRDWYIIDATDKVLGRLAVEVARRLRGKHKSTFTPHVDTGDYIVVVNAEKVQVTRAKETAKVYHRYSGYQSGLKTISFRDLRARAPQKTLEIAVKGMLPKGPLGRAMFRKLKVYAGAAHPHASQQPKTLVI
jgi:large subunit ribosomal protein L13